MDIKHLKERFGDRLRENEPLSKHVNIRIGGPARWYLEARSSEEIVEAVRAAKADVVRFAILGGGSNTLPSDEGFDGLLIQAANRNWSIESNLKPQTSNVYAEAGVLSAFLARKTAEAGLTGFDWAVSLPGTIGGAVRGNAGCFGGETKDAVVEVETLRPDGSVVRYANAECDFGYRDSIFKHHDEIILSATLALKPAPKEECLARLESALSKRKAEQPLEFSSAGCMFKNFEYRDESEIAKLKERSDVPKEFLERKRIPAGWLIEQADLKGKKIGGAAVSGKHGNFLVNTGSATASDVVQLISLVKMKIRDEYGIQLEEEVQLLGF